MSKVSGIANLGNSRGGFRCLGTERRVSATEARVRFGELLDGVTTSHDVVLVERAGKEVALVVSVEDWEAACAGRANKWARANAMLAEYHERLRTEGAIERLKDFDVVEAIRAGREERDEQLYGQLRGRESDHPSA